MKQNALQIIDAILERELGKLSKASELPHSLDQKQIECLVMLSRVARQNPEPPPPPEADPFAGMSPADILAAVKGA